MLRYTDNQYYYLRKDHKIPSTFGPEPSVLDFLLQKNYEKLTESTWNIVEKYISPNVVETFYQNVFISSLPELGLLNRLDNETAGFLYFAPNQELYNDYKTAQKNQQIQKKYIVQVTGNPFFCRDDITDRPNTQITTPLYHHLQRPDLMTTIPTKGRGTPIAATTTISLLERNPDINQSTLEVIITKGARHQIRVHLASIGAPIVGDPLYNPKGPPSEFLHLWSIGMKKI